MYTFLVFMHIVGTALGVGGATMIEVHLNKALADDDLSADERAILKTDYYVVRVGLVLAIISGFGFLLLYKMTGQVERLFDPVLWAKLVMVIMIAVNTILLQARKIPLFWGAGISFASWWLAALLGVFLTNEVGFELFGRNTFMSTFTSIILVYVLLVVVLATVLEAIRKRR